ncbi:unnamed protein product [Orchesella dallaii]|uniref:Protein inscuteable homologue C-terminal domain-containing protein n=1 Tax=Orchesella dallaii TaxID=48710 RepID=A0ABP1QL67_9HEXA
MASLSAVRSPSQQTNARFMVSTGSIPGPRYPYPHVLQHHQRQLPTCSSFLDGADSVVVGTRIISPSPSLSSACPFQRNSRAKLCYESDISSPTSWEFRNSNAGCHSISASAVAPPPSSLPFLASHHHRQVMPASSSAIILPSSSASSASTPSPLDENPYQVQMHLSLLRNSSPSTNGTLLENSPNHPLYHHHHNILHNNRHSILSTSCHSPVPPSSSASAVPQNVSNSGNCACVSVNTSSRNGTMVILNGGGVVEPDLSGNGSDGSRNSTGSHRSQDSGFSDSGESRRNGRKSVGGSGSGSNDTFNHGPLQHNHNPHVLNGSIHQNGNGSCNGTIHENGNGYHPLPHADDYECVHLNQHQQHHSDHNGNNGSISCCERPVSPSSLVQNGYGYAHIYDCIPMPSPIPPAGFGCGKLRTAAACSNLDNTRRNTPTPINSFIPINTNGICGGGPHNNPHRQENDDYATFTVTTVSPPKRPASVDISCLSRNENCVLSAVPIRMSPSPPTTCTSCLPTSSQHQDPNYYRSNLRRSFSPPRTSSPHDIALLASSSTATAVAALRVPLSSSTPKRSSVSKLIGNSSSNGTIKIDNFESLNKNVNKDNNNNSSGSSTATTPGKSGNKTFSVQSGKETRSGSQINYIPNGTVLAEETQHNQQDSLSRYEGAAGASKQSSGAATLASSSTNSRRNQQGQHTTRTAAESIYDKICSRLSSFSSSTSSTTLASPPQPTSFQNSQSQLQQSGSTASSSNGFSHSTSNSSENTTALFQKRVSKAQLSIAESSSGSKSTSNILKERQKSSSLRSTSCESSELTVASQNFSNDYQVEKLVAASSTSEKQKLKSSNGHLTKWNSLPRGVSTKRLSLLEEVSIDDHPVDVPNVPQTESHPPGTESSVTSSTSKEVQCNLQPKATPWHAVENKADSEVVRLWLCDLRTQTEPECLHSLQTKRIVPAEIHHGEDEEDFNSRSASPASTITSGGLISSSSGPPQSDNGLSSEGNPEHEHYRQNHRKSSSSSYVQRQYQRRSQQKFLSSMTAAIHAVSTPLMSIRNVEMTANLISGEFSKICKHLEFGIFTQVPTLVLSLVGHIEDFLRVFHNSIGFGNLKKLENRLESACYSLHMAAKSMNEAALMISSSSCSDSGHNSNESSRTGSSSSHPRSSCSSSTSTAASSPDCMPSSSSSGGDPFLPSSSGLSSSTDEQGPESLGREYHVVVSEVVEGIVTVGNLFSQVVDLRLTRDLACILDTIEGGGIPARIALKSLVTVLADGGNHICRLAADIRTVRGLLGVLLDTMEDQDKILALRCLATVLCVGEAVKDFDKAGGFEIIADLLYEPAYPMWMKIEAVAVLTQATDPWIDLETTLMTLGVHLEKFIVSLTNLIREFKTEEEPFLLIVAAISNLTFLEVSSTQYLKNCHSVSYLIDAVKGNPSFSVFVLDHVATIMANMAGVESCRQDIIQCGGMEALLHFLQQRPSGKAESVSAITACERLQQKSTIAISRLCNENGVARYVYDMGGVHRLVQLCRKEKERNYSDGVLIAALVSISHVFNS